MTDTNELEALKARVKELEAAQAAAKPAASNLSAAISPLLSVASLVPRWLVIAASVVALAWIGFEVYVGIQEGGVRIIKAKNDLEQERARGMSGSDLTNSVLDRQLIAADDIKARAIKLGVEGARCISVLKEDFSDDEERAKKDKCRDLLSRERYCQNNRESTCRDAKEKQKLCKDWGSATDCEAAATIQQWCDDGEKKFCTTDPGTMPQSATP